MKVTRHLALSAGISAVLFGITRSRRAAVSSFFAGVFLDLDHVVDYLAQYGVPWNLKTFFRRFYGGEIPRVVLVLHSWELLAPALWYSFVRFGGSIKKKDRSPSNTVQKPGVFAGIMIGALSHLVSDQIVNRPRPRAYFFLYRLCRGFSHPHLFPK